MSPQNSWDAPNPWDSSDPGTTVRPLEPDDPASVGEHRLLGRLGSGGMGVVYLGLAPSGRKVAVKVILREMADDPRFRARFGTEVASARRVASFCTARVLDHGEADGRPYLVTEYIEGPSLAGYLDAHGGFPADALRGLAAGVATALTAIHAVRLVHRDLKPRNVLLAADGPRVIDFGIARALDSDDQHTRTGAVVGSPGYLAPEQAFDGPIGTAADVFAWGTLVAHAATGRNPFGHGSALVLAARAHQAKYELSGVPQDLLPLVQAALDPDPARRPSAEDLLVRLVGERSPQEAAGDLIQDHWRPGPVPAAAAVPAASPSTQPGGSAGTVQPRPSIRRTWGVATVASALTAVVVLGVTAAAAYALSRDSGGDRRPPATAAADPSRAMPAPGSASPAPGRPAGPAKPSAKPKRSTKPTVTVTRPTKRWRDVGGLHRMAAYCAALGYKNSVSYSEGGRKWWCQSEGGDLRRVDLQASCRWHYRGYARVRVVQRPGPPYEVQWVCQALK
ncbi:protein kinase [Spirillospora sp. NPDC029432]|uniref:serine/threonine-protein kinase n=1 Tax=Spirillospora sp. NPDC029432 TaxID=3154599 RepID=UPI003454DC73